MARPTLTPEEVETFRTRLCEVAMERIAEHGYDGLSLRGLTEALGCSYAMPYRYFRNKQHIFAAVRALAYDRFAEALERGVERSAGDFEQRLPDMVQAYVHFAKTAPHEYKLICELGLPGPDRHPEYWPKELRSWQIWLSEVEAAVDQGMVFGDPTTIAHVLWAGLHGAISVGLLQDLPPI